MRRLVLLSPVLLLLATSPVVAGGDPDDPSLAPDARVEALFERAEAARDALHSLEARFVQRREGPLLLAPEENHGTLRLLAPNRIRWDFEPPADMVIWIGEGEMVSYFRALGEAERRTFEGGAGERLEKLLGGVPSLGELRRYFDLRVAFPADPESPYRIELEPRSRRVARRIAAARIDLHRKLFVPVYVRTEDASGLVTELRLSGHRVDPELPEELFSPDLPPEVTVREAGP
jgi:outer membrane lipoprotein-sorting protein